MQEDVNPSMSANICYHENISTVILSHGQEVHLFYAKTCHTSWDWINDNCFCTSTNSLSRTCVCPQLRQKSAKVTLKLIWPASGSDPRPQPVLAVIPNRLRDAFPEGWWPGKAVHQMDWRRPVDVRGMTTSVRGGRCWWMIPAATLQPRRTKFPFVQNTPGLSI